MPKRLKSQLIHFFPYQKENTRTMDLKLYIYSERAQNAGFHPRSHHLAIVQTRPYPPMLGFVDKGLARFNCVIFNSHITGRNTSLCLYYH